MIVYAKLVFSDGTWIPTQDVVPGDPNNREVVEFLLDRHKDGTLTHICTEMNDGGRFYFDGFIQHRRLAPFMKLRGEMRPPDGVFLYS